MGTDAVLAVAGSILLLVTAPLPAAGADDVAQQIQRLRHEDEEVREDAARDLERMGPAAAGAADALVLSLRDPHPGTRAAAASALGKVGVVDGKVLPSLERALQDRDVKVRLSAAVSLDALGAGSEKAVSVVVGALQSKDHRIAAAEAVLPFRERAKAGVPWLVGMLDDKSSHVQSVAIEALAAIGPPSSPALPGLLRLAGPEFPRLRTDAAKALCALGPKHAERVLPGIEKVMKEVDAIHRLGIAEALGRLGPAALPLIHRQRSGGDSVIAMAATKAIGLMGEEGIPVLLGIVESEDLLCGAVAADTLRGMKVEPGRLITEYRRMMLASRGVRSMQIAVQIGRLGPAGVEALSSLALEGGEESRIHAIHALGELKSEAAAALPSLRRILAEEDASSILHGAARKACAEIEAGHGK